MEPTEDPDLLTPDQGTDPASPSPSASASGAAVLSASATVDSPAYFSETPGENALTVTSGTVSINSGTIKKSGTDPTAVVATGVSSSPADNAAVWVQAASLSLSRTELFVTADSAPAFVLAQPSQSAPSALSLSNVYAEISSGDTFYISNAVADLTLSGSTFKNFDPSSNFLRAESSNLGTPGENGATARLSLVNQVIEGNITADSLSSVSLSFAQSYYMGALNPADSARTFSLTLDSTSNIILAGDSYLTSLENADPENLNIFSNGYKLFVAGEEIQINGSEAPALPVADTPTVATTEPSPTDTYTEQAPCDSGECQDSSASSGPNILFFIFGGVLIALAIVIPILIFRNKKSKN